MDSAVTENKMLEAFELWCYRRMLKISWADRVTNTEVLRRTGTGQRLLGTRKKKKSTRIENVEGLVEEKYCRDTTGLDYTAEHTKN